MARTNLAYKRQEQWQDYQAEPIPLPRPRFRTIEGQGKKTATQPVRAPWAQTLVVMSLTVFMTLATVSVARVTIANATVQMMQTSEQTRAAINEVRTEGMELEVEHSLANNPTKIQDTAALMGILPTSQPITLTARDGFSPETILQMNAAAAEVRAAELQALQEIADRNLAEKPAEKDIALEPEPTSSVLKPTADRG